MPDNAALQDLIDYWRDRQGGAERANYQLFLSQLAGALGVPGPGAGSAGALGDYQYEGPVPGGARGGGTGFIDLYKRNCFILEAKQSKLGPAPQASLDLYDPDTAAPAAPSGARYDQLMRDARRQAEHYAHSLPGSHAPVPFLIVCDVGRAFELYFDYAGNGRGYGFFPDKQQYRLTLDALTSDARLPGTDMTAAELLRAIWVEPHKVDPRTRSADVTRKVASNLAQVSRHLEEEGRRELNRRGEAGAQQEAALVEGTALFLMRILFCMFAEDIGLLPEDSFTRFLQSCVKPYDPERPGDLIKDERLRRGLIQLWARMGSSDPDDRFDLTLDAPVRYFNGGLFERQDYYRLGPNDLENLIDAAKHRWTNVEPAIFGTLLEQALSAADRAKLGAHYTPRPYVERLVQATISDVLNDEWKEVQDQIRAYLSVDEKDEALNGALRFLGYVQSQRVLDPACGTGNFLYVAMETLLRLESDIIELIASLGGTATPTIGPGNFLGLELNPRAAVIAELVMWIGWLRWRTANDPTAVPDPVLRRTQAINFGSTHGYDAVLARDNAGEVVQPPRQPDWPEAEFIVGNPPFIGKGATMRRELTSPYVAALWKAAPAMPGSADFVMFWWDRAADILLASGSMLRRFGFVTTNSITGAFNRRVVSRHLGAGAASLVFAVPDHPWQKGVKDAAAVRIAMTTCQAGNHDGKLVRVITEDLLASDEPVLKTDAMYGRIHADLTIGSNIVAVEALKSNLGISANGMLLAGRGFVLTRTEAETMIRLDGPAATAVIRSYIGGSELVQSPKDRFVIDFFGLSEREARQRFPCAYQHLLATVRVTRIGNRKSYQADQWWLFGENNPLLRRALGTLPRYIATVETAKHRLFSFVDGAVAPDHMVIAVALDEACWLGVLSSRFHAEWASVTGGTLEDRRRYNKSRCLDPFPFPDPTPDQRATIADLGEELDATRKAALAEHPQMTMTGLYNLVEKLRADAVLTQAEEVDVRNARARIVLHLHDQLDAAVAAAYGWPADLSPAEIVARLVALNAERAAEEAGGHVRWLRPDYQVPRFGETSAGSIAG